MVLRSGLPFEPAKVNKNWPRLAYGPALGYGQYSLGEYADIYLSSPVKEDAALQALKTACRTGVTVTRVQRVPYALPSVSNLAEVYRYGVEGDFAFYRPGLPAEEFFEGKHIYVTEAGGTASAALRRQNRQARTRHRGVAGCTGARGSGVYAGTFKIYQRSAVLARRGRRAARHIAKRICYE